MSINYRNALWGERDVWQGILNAFTMEWDSTLVIVASSKSKALR